jgi:Na+-driven multidrug efflux pump
VDAIGFAGAMANLLTTGVLIAVLLPFDRPVLELFLGRGSEAVETAMHIQTLGIWTYLPFGVTIVLFGSLRAYGVVWSQIAVLLLSMYLIRFGGYAVLYPHYGADSLWYSFIAGSLTSLALTLLAYFRGPWRRAMQARLAAQAKA